MTLPELLLALAERVPERVQILKRPASSGTPERELLYVAAWNYSQFLCFLSPEILADSLTGPDLAFIRQALEEEIEARGWEWSVSHRFYGVFAEVWSDPKRDGHFGEADSPAAALCTALLAALSTAGPATPEADQVQP